MVTGAAIWWSTAVRKQMHVVLADQQMLNLRQQTQPLLRLEPPAGVLRALEALDDDPVDLGRGFGGITE